MVSKMVKISVSSWSLHREIPAVWQRDVPSKIGLVDFPRLCVEEFGVDAVELRQMHFHSLDQRYVEKAKDALDRSGVRVVNILVDSGFTAELDPERPRTDFEIIRRWFHFAEYLGSPFIRVNTGAGEGEKNLQRSIEGYRETVKTAEETGVDLLIENHGGSQQTRTTLSRLSKELEASILRRARTLATFRLPLDMRSCRNLRSTRLSFM